MSDPECPERTWKAAVSVPGKSPWRRVSRMIPLNPEPIQVGSRRDGWRPASRVWRGGSRFVRFCRWSGQVSRFRKGTRQGVEVREARDARHKITPDPSAHSIRHDKALPLHFVSESGMSPCGLPLFVGACYIFLQGRVLNTSNYFLSCLKPDISQEMPSIPLSPLEPDPVRKGAKIYQERRSRDALMIIMWRGVDFESAEMRKKR
jgi:hypothetical protein